VIGVEIEFLCTTENECHRQPLGRKREILGGSLATTPVVNSTKFVM